MFVPRFEPGSQGYKKKGLTTRRHGQVHIGGGRINVKGVSRLFGETNTPAFWFATIRTTDSRVAIPGPGILISSVNAYVGWSSYASGTSFIPRMLLCNYVVLDVRGALRVL